MDQITVGKFIMQKRKEKNMTQEQLAEKSEFQTKPFLNGKPENVCRTIP